MSSAQKSVPASRPIVSARRGLSLFVLTLLAAEFLDEVVYGLREAAWPLIRDDLRLSYTQVGILLSVPPIVAHVVEPLLGILGDVWRRRALVLAGGIAFAVGTLLVGLSTGFAMLLAASILSNPASGAFIGLSQATLMDAAPERREQNMARWALAGSVGNSVGPAAIGAFVWAGVNWRWGFVATGRARAGRSRSPRRGDSRSRRLRPRMAGRRARRSSKACAGLCVRSADAR